MLSLRTFGSIAIIAFAASTMPAAAQGITGACTRAIQKLCNDYSNAPDFIAKCHKRKPDVYGRVPDECIADFQSAVEGANDAEAAEEPAPKRRQQPRRTATPRFPLDGRSYGGVLRAGPDVNSRQIGSLQENDPITILEDTGYSFNDYSWYKIRVGGRTGYHWGGIICSFDTEVDGIYKRCDN